MTTTSTRPRGEIPAGEFEYQAAKLEAQRTLDELSLSLHAAIDEDGEAVVVPDEQVAVVALASVALEAEGDYLFRGGTYLVPAAAAVDLIRWGRVRPATEEDIERHNAEAEARGGADE